MKNWLFYSLLFISSFTFAQDNYLYKTGIPDSLFSQTLNESRDFWVVLPESFDKNNSVKYPVIYILDGGLHLKALETVYSYYRGDHLPEMILVGISNRVNRTRDLTTSQVNWRNGGAVKDETGGAKNFTKFFEKELIPHVEKKYKATSYRTLAGWSYGGLFCVNAFINHTELFQNYIAIDPSLDWDNQKLLKETEKALSTRDFTGKSLFVSLAAGQVHMMDETVTLENVEQDTSEFTLFTRSILDLISAGKQNNVNNLNFTSEVFPNDFHWTTTLPSLTSALKSQFSWYQLKGGQNFANPETDLQEILTMIKSREEVLRKNFGYKVPPIEEELCNQGGYMYLQFGQPEKSLAFFKMATEYYPESANAFDSLADYYEEQKDYKKAIESVEKAYELSGNEYYQDRLKELKKKK